MAPQAYWKGHIRLSLVTFPVRLYTAITSSEKIELHKYDRETGQRIHYQNVNEDGEAVAPEDIVKGYEYQKGSYIEVDQDALDDLKIESRHTIDLIQFTELKSIDPIYYERPYFVAPDGDIAAEAFVTLREALRQSGSVALGQVVLSNKERIVAIKPCGRGMILETLRYNAEVRKADEYFSAIEKDMTIDDEQLKLARQLIEMKKADFNPEDFIDQYQESLKEIIEARLEHRVPDLKDETRRPGKVVNIMDALRKSLAQSEDKEKAGQSRSRSGAGKPPARKKTPPTRRRAG